jgi:hypothetical protein
LIELIYDNKLILPFWEEFFAYSSLEYRLNDISSFEIDLEKAPDEIIYLNCTGHFNDYSSNSLIPVKIEQYLDYLAIYNRNVINDFNTINYSFNLIEQYRLFKRCGLSYPLTVFSSEVDEFISMCGKLPQSFNLISNTPSATNKENIFENVNELKSYLSSDKFSNPNNDTLIARQFIPPKENKHQRALIIDGKVVYVYNIEKENNNFELISKIDDINPLLDKYIELTNQTGFNYSEIEFIKASNNVIYTLCLRPAPIVHNEIESKINSAGKNALLSLLKSK